MNNLKKYRRDLHQIPELELTLPLTQQYVIENLKDLDCTLFKPITYGVAAFFDNHKEKTIAFRSDMDALPISECNDMPYKSKHPGCMHACGHDGHMAMLLGFAHELNTYYKELPHNVLLIFQPGEESPGGAKLICETGIFQKYNVKHIFGTHLWPDFDFGVIGTRPNECMAHSSEIHIDIYGTSSHVANAKMGKDAMEAACDFLLQVYAFERSYDEKVFRILKFGKMTSGTVCNAISDHTHMEGTMRAFQDEVFYGIQNAIQSIGKQIETKYGVQFQVQFKNGYPPVMNDEKLTRSVLKEIPDIYVMPEPTMIAEDFAYYQTVIPGTFFLLGTGTHIPLHSDHWDFDENVLSYGVALDKKLSWIEG